MPKTVVLLSETSLLPLPLILPFPPTCFCAVFSSFIPLLYQAYTRDQIRPSQEHDKLSVLSDLRCVTYEALWHNWWEMDYYMKTEVGIHPFDTQITSGCMILMVFLVFERRVASFCSENPRFCSENPIRQCGHLFDLPLF